MRRVFIALLSLGLIAGVAVAGYLTLQGCGLNAPFLQKWLPGTCHVDDAEDARTRLFSLKLRNESLRRDVIAAERALAQLQCDAVYEQPLPVDPRPTLPDITPAPKIDEDAWREGDLGALSGCWDLDSDYRMQNNQTGALRHFSQWRMCFDANGLGTEEMTATNGIRCSGTVSGRFDRGGHLGINEPGNLQCSDGTMIFQRVLNCALSGDGTASCTETQPEMGRTSTVRLRRSKEGQ